MGRYQRGWLRVVEHKQGRVWQFRYYVVDPMSGKKKERATTIGSLADFPTESKCWREIDRQRLTEQINQPQICDKLRFRHIAEFYLNSDAAMRISLRGPLRLVTMGAGIPTCETPSAIHFNSRRRSLAVCHRSSGSFAKHVFTTRSSWGGVIGCNEEIGGGSASRIFAIKLA
jgi:hypothetical protein